MAMKFAAREVLVLAIEDDCTCRSNSENREGIYGAIHAYPGKIRFSTKGLEDVGAVMGEAIPGPGPLASLPEGSLRFLRMNYRKKIT